MTEETPVPASDNAENTPAQEGDTSGNSHMIPKARLDAEIAKRREIEESLSHMAESVIATVPEAFRELIPDGSPAAKAAWVQKAHNTGLFSKPTVPTTDTGKPSNTTPKTDWSTLPAHERMARGYK